MKNETKSAADREKNGKGAEKTAISNEWARSENFELKTGVLQYLCPESEGLRQKNKNSKEKMQLSMLIFKKIGFLRKKSVTHADFNKREKMRLKSSAWE